MSKLSHPVTSLK